MVRPIKLFALLVLTIIGISAASLLLSRADLKIGSKTLQFPSILETFDLQTDTNSTDSYSLNPDVAMLQELLDSIVNSSSLDSAYNWADTSKLDTTRVDSLILRDTSTLFNSPEGKETNISADVLRSRIVPIQSTDSTLRELWPFFRSLATDYISKNQVRIMHYGDSQIEGDRITSFLRARLQSRFGGGGIGLLHAIPHSYQPGGVIQSASQNWKQTLISDLPKSSKDHQFGILGGYSFFTRPRTFQKGGFGEAWISFQRKGKTLARNYTSCKIIYGHGSEPFMVSIQFGGKVQDAEMCAPTNHINHIQWKVPLTEATCSINFKGDESPLIYGVSLETSTGIIIDNIAIRGSSGADFTRSDENTLKKALEIANPKLIVLQFGVNVVPNVVKSYRYYENQILQQISAIKRAKPNASIILIGVSDMSRKEGDSFVSYPNIELIRDAQRNAALKGGAAFWDCYEAMGGKNSMPAWVFASPALASKDFVHFTTRGANLIAEMFYASLMDAYSKHINSKK